MDASTYREFQREIEATQGKLRAFQKQAEDTVAKIELKGDTRVIEKMKSSLKELKSKAKEVGKEIGSAISTGAAAVQELSQKRPDPSDDERLKEFWFASTTAKLTRVRNILGEAITKINDVI